VELISMQVSQGDVFDLLRNCVVAITHGESSGTGFFVAPNRVLTCQHVLEDSENPIELRWHGQRRNATIWAGQKKNTKLRNVDLAVLKIENGSAAWDHPCVLLGSEIQLKDNLYTFGHPEGDYREGGESETFEYEGPVFEGKLELYKMKMGEAVPGLSGSPLLNLSSAKVCGVVSTTRGQGTLLGGGAVPIRYLKSIADEIWSANLKYNETHSSWATYSRQIVERGTSISRPIKAHRRPVSSKKPRIPLEKANSDVRSLEKQKFQLWKTTKAAIDAERYGIRVDTLIIDKQLHDDGNSLFTYQVEGLRVSRGPLTGLRCIFEVTAGIVGEPELDDRGKRQQIMWQRHSERRTTPLPVEDKLKSVRKVSGVFVFDGPLGDGDPPVSFGWSIKVLNGDALSDWEYEHLYSNELQVHMNNVPLASPTEYFARTVWFPVKTLKLRFHVPSRITKDPFLSVFKCGDKLIIPIEEVVNQGILQGIPRPESNWVKENVAWQRDRLAQRAESNLVQKLKPAKPEKNNFWRIFEFSTKQPPVGWCYSLDWLLPEHELDKSFHYLVLKSEEIQRKLIAYGGRRQSDESDPVTQKIQEVFRSFGMEICESYRLKEERITITLMTYDSDKRRLVMVEAFKNSADISREEWNFWLPFGLGLAGACFRQGDEALAYVRPDKLTEDAEYYLPISNSEKEFLLAVPLDHPEFSEQSGILPSDRCRQLVGVLTIGSSRRASRLNQFRTAKAKEGIATFRAKCQQLSDKIVDILNQS
jgi:Trypsin-like peptidase domain